MQKEEIILNNLDDKDNLLEIGFSSKCILRSPESPTNYYSSSSYKPQKGHMCSGPMYSKYTSHHGADAVYMQARSKSHRDVHHPSNLSPKRKIHYDDELGDIEKLKLIDEELGNIVEGNMDENVEEEITGSEFTKLWLIPDKSFRFYFKLIRAERGSSERKKERVWNFSIYIYSGRGSGVLGQGLRGARSGRWSGGGIRPDPSRS